MSKVDRWIGLFFFLLSSYVCWQSLRLGLGTMHRPGPGFMPFYSGAVLGVLSAALLVLGFFRHAEEGEPWERWFRILLVAVSLFGFTELLEVLGFLPCTFLFIGFLLKVVERRGWGFSLAVSLLVSIVSYVVFDILLKAQLPAGILER